MTTQDKQIQDTMQAAQAARLQEQSDTPLAALQFTACCKCRDTLEVIGFYTTQSLWNLAQDWKEYSQLADVVAFTKLLLAVYECSSDDVIAIIESMGLAGSITAWLLLFDSSNSRSNSRIDTTV